MITAVDTSVLLDVFKADFEFGQRSKKALRQCMREGRLIACGIVFAEIACAFTSEQRARDAMRCLGVEFESCSLDAALACGEAFRAYRARGGRRERVIADFLIGAHAQKHADRLLTRDRGFQRTYFCSLTVIDPSGEP